MTRTRLIDVARAAGVSRGTASNVFNNPEMVRPQLRERVEAAARDMGYLGPDPKGKLLRSGKLNAIGVMSPAVWGVADSLGNPVYSNFLLGVAEACDTAGASLLIVPDGTASDNIRTALVDGFIFGRIEQLERLKVAKLRRLPFAIVDIDVGSDVNSVVVDAFSGGYSAARHLVDLGHRHFGIMSFLRSPGDARVHAAGTHRGPEMAGMAIDHEKLRGYAKALSEVGVDIDEVPIVQAEPGDSSAAGLVLDAAPQATAILSMSVMQAIAVLAEARRRNIRVPQDLSVIGYNDIVQAAHSDPPLTTIDALNVEKGRLAAQLVLDGGSPQQMVLKPRLILRASTGPAPGSSR